LSSKKVPKVKKKPIFSTENVFMKAKFWSNLDQVRKEAGIERKAIIEECDLPNNAFTQGIRRKSDPGVSTAYRLARCVNKTVEELVDGETGAEYVRKIVRNDPKAIQVPDRISSIVGDLLFLDENELIGIRANVGALAMAKKGNGVKTGTDGLAG
jgi:hypothetical protein